MTTFPLVIGSDAQFLALRTALDDLRFTEAGICERTRIKAIQDFEPAPKDAPRPADDGLNVLIALLMDGAPLSEADFLRHIPNEILKTCVALGVLARDPEAQGTLYGTVFLYPVAGLRAASDRTHLISSIRSKLPEDAVYAAITGNTGRFLSILPNEPCDDFLDLCSGTGIAAMVAASRYAKHAWAADLGPRCVHFAEFNRRLCGLDNVQSVQGDLYEAIGDRTFDRIVAHPPYVPNKDREFLFRDGGADGEQILRRIVEGLPKHLRAGGRFYCQSFATDREDETLDQRLRRWLGPAESEFDVILTTTESRQRPEAFLKAVVNSKGRLGKLDESTQHLMDLKVTNLFYGSMVLSRKTDQRPAATGRIQKAAAASSEVIEWFRRWHEAAAFPDFPVRLLETKPAPAARLKLVATHIPVDGVLTPSEFNLKTDYPFISEAKVEPWLAIVAGQCTGRSTIREIYEEMKAQEVIAPDVTDLQFAGFIQVLLTNAFLEIREFALPVTRSTDR